MREILLPTRQMRRSSVRLRVHSDSGAWCVYVALYASLYVALYVYLYASLYVALYVSFRLRVHSALEPGVWCECVSGCVAECV